MARFQVATAQHGSLFFRKLPPEVRRLVYKELFGDSTIHIGFSDATEFLRPGRPERTLPGWWHCVCRKQSKVIPHPHGEMNHKWCYLSIQLLFTCKRAFQEGVPVLYGNRFSFHWALDLVSFATTFHLYYRLVSNIDLFLSGWASSTIGRTLAAFSFVCASYPRVVGNEQTLRIVCHDMRPPSSPDAELIELLHEGLGWLKECGHLSVIIVRLDKETAVAYKAHLSRTRGLELRLEDEVGVRLEDANIFESDDMETEVCIY